MAYDLQAAQIYLPKNKVIWDNTYKNVIRFTTDEKISQLLDLRLFYENYNFVFNNFLKPNSIVLSINENSDFNAIEMANLKMIVVKAFFATETRFFYYFADSVVQINGTTWRYNLSLDVLTTLKINKDFRINGIFTERLHFDRYQKNSSGNIILSTNIYDLQTANDIDSGVDSADYIYNVVQNEKPAKNIEYVFQVSVTDPEVLKKEITPKGYILIYVQNKNCKHNVRVWASTREEARNQFRPWFSGNVFKDEANYYKMPYAIYVVPLLDVAMNLNTIYSNTGQWGTTGNKFSFDDTIKRIQADTSNVILDIRFSSYLPADLLIYSDLDRTANFRIDELTIPEEDSEFVNVSLDQITQVLGRFNNMLVLFNIFKDYSIYEESISIYDMLRESDFFRIPSTATKQTFRRLTYEPQMLKKPYCSITIKSPYSEGYDFSFFDIINSNLDLSATFRKEVNVVIESAKELNYFINTRKGTGLFGNVDNKVGDVSNPVYNLTWENDSLAEYLRQNKNAQMTSALTPIASGVVGGALGFLTSANPVLAVISAAITATGSLINNAIKFDDIKNKPNAIKLGSNALIGDYVFNKTMLPKIYVKGLRQDKREMVFDWIYRYGYSWNRASNSIDWFNRYIFNYVKTIDSVHAHIEGLAAAPFINEAIENELSRILNDGVTFWEEDSGHIYNWEYENFEKAILEN